KLEKNKSRKYPFWMGIAATIVGGILILSLVFNQKEMIEPVKVVETPSEKLSEEKIIPRITEEVKIASEEPKNIEKVENPAKNEKNNSISEAVFEEKIEVAENDKIETLLEEENNEQFSTFSTSEEKLMQQKVQEILAEVSSKENQNKTVSESEINDLLAKAALELSLEKNSSFAESYDADDLLYEVEMELEQSFRGKIFDALKEGFEKTRTAVANRY
ncbi:MAG TPA: hypothetical protein VFM59_04170, partial [Salinimicrobium sp.]|nr:hypothetical protein [Salinimicrobium sp.]